MQNVHNYLVNECIANIHAHSHNASLQGHKNKYSFHSIDRPSGTNNNAGVLLTPAVQIRQLCLTTQGYSFNLCSNYHIHEKEETCSYFKCGLTDNRASACLPYRNTNSCTTVVWLLMAQWDNGLSAHWLVVTIPHRPHTSSWNNNITRILMDLKTLKCCWNDIRQIIVLLQSNLLIAYSNCTHTHTHTHKLNYPMQRWFEGSQVMIVLHTKLCFTMDCTQQRC